MDRREYKAIAYEYDLVSRILLCLIYAANIVIFIYITNFHYFFNPLFIAQTIRQKACGGAWEYVQG